MIYLNRLRAQVHNKQAFFMGVQQLSEKPEFLVTKEGKAKTEKGIFIFLALVPLPLFLLYLLILFLTN